MTKIIYGACICMAIIVSLEACRVSFHASHKQQLIQPVVGRALVFNDVLTNEGSGYNPATGIFTAPVTGTYNLGFQAIMKGFTSLLGASIEVDGKLVSYLEAYNRRAYDESYARAVVYMKQGQRASVICRALRPNKRVKIFGHQGSIFSGFLIG